jgi:hypothetical protein
MSTNLDGSEGFSAFSNTSCWQAIDNRIKQDTVWTVKSQTERTEEGHHNAFMSCYEYQAPGKLRGNIFKRCFRTVQMEMMLRLLQSQISGDETFLLVNTMNKPLIFGAFEVARWPREYRAVSEIHWKRENGKTNSHHFPSLGWHKQWLNMKQRTSRQAHVCVRTLMQ